MSHKTFLRIIVVLLIVLLLSACGSSEKPKPTYTPYPTYTALPSLTPYATLTPYPTFTALPSLTPYATLTAYPTYTALPSLTPYATLTPYPTYTPLPSQTPYPTCAPLVVIITATPVVPTLAVTVVSSPVAMIAPTLIASAVPENGGCLRYAVQAGDTLMMIAVMHGVSIGDLLDVNHLSEQDAAMLQIGQVLIIPGPGCTALNAATTVPPAANAPVFIAGVLDWGKLDSEAVVISNQGSVVNVQGWTLSSERGDTFTFLEFRMFQGSKISVFSRQGQDTPVALYWGRTSPAWIEGETVTLRDAAGQVQAAFRVGQPAQ